MDSAAIVTQVSKRTLRRRLSEGQITRHENDSEGRTMLNFEDIIPMLCIPLNPEDQDLLIKAASGDTEAQNDLALLFFDADKLETGLHWLKAAANQGSPDAMHHLSKLYISGVGTSKDENVGLMWLAKAASMGHPIADQQVKALTQFRQL